MCAGAQVAVMSYQSHIITYEEVDKKEESEHDVEAKERVSGKNATPIGLREVRPCSQHRHVVVLPPGVVIDTIARVLVQIKHDQLPRLPQKGLRSHFDQSEYGTNIPPTKHWHIKFKLNTHAYTRQHKHTHTHTHTHKHIDQLT